MGCPGPFAVGSDFSGLGEDRRLGGGLLLGNRLLAADVYKRQGMARSSMVFITGA